MKKFLSDAQRSFSVEVNRNSFDVSKTHGATYNFGYIYPMFVRPISPNESFRIKASGGFDLFPMIGVPRTHVKCNTAWFYVRNRQVWRGAKKFSMQDPTSKTSAIPHPLINTADRRAFSIGSLLNHMGVPVVTFGASNSNARVGVDASSFLGTVEVETVPGNVASNYSRHRVNYILTPRSVNNWNTNAEKNAMYMCHKPFATPSSSSSLSKSDFPVVYSMLDGVGRGLSLSGPHGHHFLFSQPMVHMIDDYASTNGPSFVFSHIMRRQVGTDTYDPIGTSARFCLSFYAPSSDGSKKLVGWLNFKYTSASGAADGVWSVGSPYSFTLSVDGSLDNVTSVQFHDFILTPGEQAITTIQELQQNYEFLYVVLSHGLGSEDSSVSSHSYSAGTLLPSTDETKPTPGIVPGFVNGFTYRSKVLVSDDSYSPFVGLDGAAMEHINALPVRAYEAIYNSHFRNRILDPFKIDGEIAVDRYVTNDGDGLDSTTPLVLQKCTYESDYFTTCVPSPQGNMFHQPLVGVTMGSDPNTAILKYDDNGNSYEVEVKTDGNSNMVGLNYHSEDADKLTIATLKDAISYGISLHDLENVRALSRWYEATYRKGRFSYDDFVQAHFGKRPTRDEQMAPEYLGGTSIPLEMMRVINNTLSEGSAALGASGGLGSFASRKDDVIEVYADEEGFVIGVCWFSVSNTYGQAIDKFWYRKLPSDYPTPEFANLGTQPVLNKEIAPLQCQWMSPSTDGYANGTFGYQRMYGDKLQAFDTVAGLFLSDLSPFVLYRMFGSVPKLGVDFITQDPNDLNNIFVNDNDKDKIYGWWHFDVTTKMWLQQTPNAQIY